MLAAIMEESKWKERLIWEKIKESLHMIPKPQNKVEATKICYCRDN